jgi:uncharacterized membrane protein YkvA (DUF1232 family)
MTQPGESIGPAKRQLWLSLILLGIGILYAIFPFDFIPDFLGPIGWVDDIAILAIGFLTALASYYKLHKAQSG